MSINITFSNNCATASFTLGHLGDGASYTIGSNMTLSVSVVSPLSPGGVQNLIVSDGSTAVDLASDALSILTPFISAVSQKISQQGIASVSVVWTCYELGVRFGIAANIDTSEKANIEHIFSSAGSQGWSYMLDSAPDKPPAWVQPNQTQPLSNLIQGPISLSIAPSLQEGGVTLVCSVSDSTGSNAITNA